MYSSIVQKDRRGFSSRLAGIVHCLVLGIRTKEKKKKKKKKKG